MIKKNNNFFDYIIVLTLLLLADSPFFLMVNAYAPFACMMILWMYAIYKRKLRNSVKIIQVLMVVYALIIIQGILYGGFTPAGIYKPLLYLFTPFLLYRLMGLKYFKYVF